MTAEYREHRKKKMKEIRDLEAEEEELLGRNPKRQEKRRISDRVNVRAKVRNLIGFPLYCIQGRCDIGPLDYFVLDGL